MTNSSQNNSATQTANTVLLSFGFNSQQINTISQSQSLMNQLNQHLNRQNSKGVPAEIRETYHDQYGNARNDVNGFVYGEKTFDLKGDYGNIYIATENKDGTATTEYERLATLIHELGHTYYLEETAKIDLEQNPNQSLNEYVENAMYAEGLAEYFKNQVYSELSNEFRQEAGFERHPEGRHDGR